jgi:hypothetical protein
MDWKQMSAQARTAIRERYFAHEQADLLALLNTLDQLWDLIEAGGNKISDEQLEEAVSLLRGIISKPPTRN